jgi:hypothetical protein
MEKYLVRKNIASNITNAKALLGLFAVGCFAFSATIFVSSFEDKTSTFANYEEVLLP